MTRKLSLLVFLAMLAAACINQRVRLSAADRIFSSRLSGQWTAQYSLTISPLFISDAKRLQQVAGRLVLLANTSVTARYTGLGPVTNYGSYSIDFSRFGLPLTSGSIPPSVVVASIGEDSAKILLDANRAEGPITMIGKVSGDSIEGTWTFDLGRGGSVGGSFVMTKSR